MYPLVLAVLAVAGETRVDPHEHRVCFLCNSAYSRPFPPYSGAVSHSSAVGVDVCAGKPTVVRLELQNIRAVHVRN